MLVPYRADNSDFKEIRQTGKIRDIPCLLDFKALESFHSYLERPNSDKIDPPHTITIDMSSIDSNMHFINSSTEQILLYAF